LKYRIIKLLFSWMCNIIVHYYETDYIIMPPPYGGRYAIPRSVRLSLCPSPRRAAAVGTLASCSLAMCGLRTRPRTDVDPPCHSQLLIAMCWIVYSSCNDQMPLLILAPTDDLCGWAMRAVATIALSTCSHSPLRSCKLFYSVL